MNKLIAKGVALLDEHFEDSSWVKDIDLDILDVSNSCNCVLGQLFGHYDRGYEILFLHIDSQISDIFECGFNTLNSYSELTKEWKEALTATQ